MLKVCALVPCYRHGHLIAPVLKGLRELNLPVIVIDDGCEGADKEALHQACHETEGVTLLRQKPNQGKGAAMRLGFEKALELGFTHALQADADGQHDLKAVPDLLQVSAEHPEAVISGKQIFDSSAPKGRVYGRKITDFWVMVETCSRRLSESMCGFRVYPLQAVHTLYQKVQPGRGMDFDTDILVRLYWQGCDVLYVPVKVRYLQDNSSNFRVFADNVKISFMHARLCLAMLPRLPALIRRNRAQGQTAVGTDKGTGAHWAKRPEVPGLFGMKLLLTIQRLLGRKVCQLLLPPVTYVYYLCAKQGRAASELYLQRLQEYARAQGHTLPEVSVFAHFAHFSAAMLDKIDAWQGRLRIGRDLTFAPGTKELIDRVCDKKQGCIVLTSHLGNIEACRALIEQHRHIVLNAVVFEQNSAAFARVMSEYAPGSRLNLIDASAVGPETAMLLSDKLQRGEWVAIACDRLSVHKGHSGTFRTMQAEFLGKPACFAAGPFVLAQLFEQVPLLQLFGCKEQGVIAFSAVKLTRVKAGRKERDKALQSLCQQYAGNLQDMTLRYPLEWFNFFDFWAQVPSEPGKGEEHASHTGA